MTAEEILKNNRIIANFMGLKNIHAPDWFTDGGKIGFYADDENCYHSDWNLLMPVVEKFNKMVIEKRTAKTNWTKWQFRTIMLTTDINKLFKDTVDSIQWYNKQSN